MYTQLPSRFNLGERNPKYALERRLGGPQGGLDVGEKITSIWCYVLFYFLFFLFSFLRLTYSSAPLSQKSSV
jgi:hypothetical protein